MLGIRTLLHLEPKGQVLTHPQESVLPPWLGTLSVEGIRGRWGRTNVTVKGDDKAMLSMKQIYQHIPSARAGLGERDVAA